jgi:hypothetical protein
VESSKLGLEQHPVVLEQEVDVALVEHGLLDLIHRTLDPLARFESHVTAAST